MPCAWSEATGRRWKLSSVVVSKERLGLRSAYNKDILRLMYCLMFSSVLATLRSLFHRTGRSCNGGSRRRRCCHCGSPACTTAP